MRGWFESALKTRFAEREEQKSGAHLQTFCKPCGPDEHAGRFPRVTFPLELCAKCAKVKRYVIVAIKEAD